MDKIGEIEVKVMGKHGNSELRPENYDIKHIISMLNHVEDMLFPTSKKERPLITYDIEEGSVKHKFKTSIQAIIGFSALLGQISQAESIDFLELKSARAIESIQKISREKNYNFLIKTSLEEEYQLQISPQTEFFRNEKTWVEAEFYFYGKLKDAGGKNKANIHVDTVDYGYIAIETGVKFLESRKENMLYKDYGIRATGLQNLETGEIDTKSLTLVELIDYDPTFNEKYIKELIKKSSGNWIGFNSERWISETRGNYEA